jgi:PAS domain S-box-containing protein
MIINIRERLAEFRVVTTQRIKAINISGPGSEIDQRYDSIFNEFITEAEEAETMLQKKMKRDLKYFRFAFVSMIILSSSIFLTVIIIFRRFDKQQLKNLRSLNKATMALETENKESRKTAETLRESEERYHSLISNISNVTWITNDSGETTFISPNIEKVYGYTAEEIYAAGDSLWLGRIHPEDIEKVKNAYDNLFKKEGHFNIQYRIQRKDGEWIWLHDNAMTTYEKEGLRFAYGVFSDITERKNVENALKESTERFRGLVESTSDWIWEIDENAVYTYVSPKTYDILGYTPEEVLGRRPFDFMTPEEVKRVSDFFSSIIDARKPFNNLQNINIHKNGNLVFLETSGVPIFNHKGEFCGYRGIDRDITDRKQDEEELEKHRKHLEEMVRDRTKELEEKTKDLEDYNKLFAEREFRIKELKDRIKKLEREKSNK